MSNMLVLIVSFFLGALFVLLLELLALYRWFRVQPIAEPTNIPTYVPVSTPEEIVNYCGLDGATEKESCMFLNLIFEFLWREWRDSPKTRDFFIRKMNMEFQEMLLNKAAGKVMEQITVRDYNLGDSMPVLKNVTVMKIDGKPPSMVGRELDFAVDIDYTGGFIISLDVDLIFGKKASMTVRLKALKGRIRLQFTRNPCTHWSFSFYEDPHMDLYVDSNIEGRKLTKLTTFIRNQIRKSIKKKHTLPRYKVRYKPFFVQEKPQDGKKEVYIHNSLVTEGKLNLEVVECTRIPQLPKGSHVYCSLSLDSLPWKEDMPMRRSLWPVHEVLMCRSASYQAGSIGVSFNRYFENDGEIIMIKTIKPNSPASQVDIQRGDLLISVNNVDITTMKQAVRLIKNAGDRFTFKLQRPPSIELQQSQLLEANDQSTTGGDFVDSKDKKSTTNKTNSASTSRTDEYFGYNSVLVREEDDTDAEEFVNIVVNEISEALSHDSTKQNQFLNTVELMTPALKLDNNDLHAPGARSEEASLGENDKEMSASTESLSNTATKVPRRRSLRFFRRKSHSTSDLHKLTTDIPDGGENSFNSSSNRTGTKERFRNWLESSFSSFNGDSLDQGSPKVTKKDLETTETESQSTSSTPPLSQPPLINGVVPSVHISMPSPLKKQDSHEWDNISEQNVDASLHVESHTDEDKEPTGQATTLLNSNKELVWNETFAFDVEKEHRFLNVCVWSKHEDSYDKEVLLGYISIPLMELSIECLSTSSRKNIRSFHLAATSSRPAVSRAYLRTVMPGMNLGMCNGDITLAYQYTINVPESDLEVEQYNLVMDRLKKLEEAQPEDDLDQERVKEHNFVGQEFYFPQRCDYCQNKIWRKVAFQCRVCAMVSHKRCIQNAQTNTYCTSKGVCARPPKWELNNPPDASSGNTNSNKTTDTLLSADSLAESMEVPQNSMEEDYTSFRLSSSIKNHEDDLRPGIKNGRLSPSNVLRRRRQPNQQHVRRISLQDFVLEEQSIESIPEDVEDGALNDSIATAAVTAKEAGRELFASLDKDDRHEEIQQKVCKLQKEITAENEEHDVIKTTLESTVDEHAKQRIEVSLRKSEERSQALALLMIQYCAALNECLSVSEPQHV